MPDDHPLLKLSEVATRCGVDIAVLKELAREGQLPGMVRGQAGHVYVPEDAVPDWHTIVMLVETQMLEHLRRAKVIHRKIAEEVESLGMDIDEAMEHPRDLIGDDLAAFDAISVRNRSALSHALERLQTEAWSISTYNELLRKSVEVR